MRIRKIQVAEAIANYGNNAFQNRYSCKGRIIECMDTVTFVFDRWILCEYFIMPKIELKELGYYKKGDFDAKRFTKLDNPYFMKVCEEIMKEYNRKYGKIKYACFGEFIDSWKLDHYQLKFLDGHFKYFAMTKEEALTNLDNYIDYHTKKIPDKEKDPELYEFAFNYISSFKKLRTKLKKMTEHDIRTLKFHCNGFATYIAEIRDEKIEPNDVSDYLLSNNKDDDIFVLEW